MSRLLHSQATKHHGRGYQCWTSDLSSHRYSTEVAPLPFASRIQPGNTETKENCEF